MSEPKNKGGRPRRVPGEKLQRLTLNLRPSVLFGLEVVAKHRRTSLSQAAEYLIAQSLRSYEIDGKTGATPLLETFADIIANTGRWVARDRLTGETVPEVSVEDRKEMVKTGLLQSEAGRMLLTPRSLLSPKEKYFSEAFLIAMKIKDDSRHIVLTPAFALFQPSALTALYAASEAWEMEGVPIEDAAERLFAMIPDVANVQFENDDAPSGAKVSAQLRDTTTPPTSSSAAHKKPRAKRG